MAQTIEAFWFITNQHGDIVAMVSKLKFPKHLNDVIVSAFEEMLKEKLSVDTYNMIVKP